MLLSIGGKENLLPCIKSEISYRTEDIIAYVSPQGGLITHRVKEALDYGYIAQGDASNIPGEKEAAYRLSVFVILISDHVYPAS